MPPASVNELSRAIGALEASVSNLTKTVDEERVAAANHRQALRETIAALAEAVRKLTTQVTEMEPIVEDYRQKTLEARGMVRLGRWMMALFIAISGAIGWLLSWLLSHWKGLGIILIVLVLATASLAQEHQHPPQHQALHDAFYSTWYRPNNPHMSRYNKKDCYPTSIKLVDGKYYARRREDGHWVYINPDRLEQNQTDMKESPDGQSHACMGPPGVSNTVYCATLGAGI